jgi:carboxyl-terminal processing protease
MIRLTIAHYYTPAGRCIQKPYEKGKGEDYAMDMQNRLLSGELTNADSIHFADSLRYYTRRKHRVVYGGGGSMPDHFVPLDTTLFTRFHRALQAKSIVLNANLRYVDEHRSELKQRFNSFTVYQKTFEIPQSLIDTIVAEGERQDIKPKDNEELERTLPYLKQQLKALVARDLWGMDEYFAIMNESNPIVREAVKLLE